MRDFGQTRKRAAVTPLTSLQLLCLLWQQQQTREVALYSLAIGSAFFFLLPWYFMMFGVVNDASSPTIGFYEISPTMTNWNLSPPSSSYSPKSDKHIYHPRWKSVMGMEENPSRYCLIQSSDTTILYIIVPTSIEDSLLLALQSFEELFHFI